MSKEEIEANKCGMCSSEDHSEMEPDEKSCCSNEAILLKLDTDATSAQSRVAAQPLFVAPVYTGLLDADLLGSTAEEQRLPFTTCRTFPLAETHTVLRV